MQGAIYKNLPCSVKPDYSWILDRKVKVINNFYVFDINK
jgi:hypothetical protein